MSQHEDFDPPEAAQALNRIQDDIAPGAGADTSSRASPKNAASSPSSSSPNSADDEPCEPSSPVCYLNEFKDW
jgi:hypothetical protein